MAKSALPHLGLMWNYGMVDGLRPTRNRNEWETGPVDFLFCDNSHRSSLASCDDSSDSNATIQVNPSEFGPFESSASWYRHCSAMHWREQKHGCKSACHQNLTL